MVTFAHRHPVAFSALLFAVLSPLVFAVLYLLCALAWPNTYGSLPPLSNIGAAFVFTLAIGYFSGLSPRPWPDGSWVCSARI